MRRSMILSTALLVLCMSFAVTGCSSKSGDSKTESKTETKAEAAAAGSTESSGYEYDCPGTGYSFNLPENLKLTKGFVNMHDVGDVDYDSGVMMGWPVYRDITEENYLKLSPENINDVNLGFSFQIYCVKDANSEQEAKDNLFALIEKMTGEVTEEQRKLYGSLKLIHQENGYVWMMMMDPRAEAIREENKEEYNAFYDASDEIISSMKFYPPQRWQGSEEGTVLSFETIDLNGNPVRSDTLFAQHKVTMINIWATTCGPCIMEMPELEALNREFEQKGGAIVGLVDDVWVSNMKYLDEAKEIVEDIGVTFPNLCAWDGYDDALEAVGTPTTYFVDSQGRVIGDAILGAHTNKYKEKMELYLSQVK